MRAPNPPILAILGDVEPREVLYVAAVLSAAGVRAFEIPMNGPVALESLQRICAVFGREALCCAGDVLTPEDVDAAALAGAAAIGAANADPAVIARAVERGLRVTRVLKVAANETLEPGGSETSDDIYVRRDAGAADTAFWRAAGRAGLGVAEELYKPGDALFDVVRRAAVLVDAWNAGSAARADARWALVGGPALRGAGRS